MLLAAWSTRVPINLPARLDSQWLEQSGLRSALFTTIQHVDILIAKEPQLVLEFQYWALLLLDNESRLVGEFALVGRFVAILVNKITFTPI
jgi:hypothetical protein